MTATFLDDQKTLEVLRAKSADGVNVEVWKVVRARGDKITAQFSDYTYTHGLHKAEDRPTLPFTTRASDSRVGIHAFVHKEHAIEWKGVREYLVRCTARLEDYIAGATGQRIWEPIANSVVVFSQIWMHLDEVQLTAQNPERNRGVSAP